MITDEQPEQVSNLRAVVQIGGLAALAGLILWLAGGGAHRAASLLAAPAKPAVGLDYGVPPAGVPLFYYVDPRQPNWLVAADWSGKPRGTVKRLPADGVFPLQASPDGSSLVVGGRIYSHSGPTGAAWQTGRGLPVWADDSRHMCAFGSSGNTAGDAPGSEVLQTLLVGQELVTVGPIGGTSSLAGAEVVACSFRTNRVLVVQHAPSAGIHEYWLAGLPNGMPIYHQVLGDATGTQYTDLVVSPDARYVAEMVMDPTPSGAVVRTATIHEAAGGAALARLGSGWGVLKFSADGEAALVVGPNSNKLSVIKWRTGKALWTLSPKDLADPHEVLMTSIANPRSLGFVLALWRPQTGSCPGGARICTTADASPAQELLMVGGDGSRRIVARHVTLVPVD